MPECGECGAATPEGANFCPNCGAPQNRKAAENLEAFVQRQAAAVDRQGVGGDDDRDRLWNRVGYALGWAAVVGGLWALPDPGGAFVLLGGVASLPPVRRLASRPFDAQFRREVSFGAFVVLVGIGVAVFWFV